MDSFIKCLPAIIRSAGAAPEVLESAAIAAWKHAAGESLSGHTVPLRLENGTLFVAVADSVWQKHLNGILGEMLFRVNRILGQQVVNFIELQVDESAFPKHRGKDSRQSDQADNDIPLELWAAANAITDKHLRQSFLKTVLLQTRRLEK